MLKAVIFDRDGVLIKNYGYVCDINKIKWLKGAIEALQLLKEKKIKIFLASNQSGVARGFFTIKQVEYFHKYMNKVLKKFNTKINKFYFSPYHPCGKIKKYTKRTNMRKPGNGMILKILKENKLKRENIIFIGDSKVDFLAAKKSLILFEYKKRYSLKKQIKKILNKYDI